MQPYFELRGKISESSKAVLEISFLIFAVLLWSGLAISGKISPGILPAPWKVLSSFKELHFQDALVRNAMYSIGLNLLGYVEAILVALPLGFAIGLFPAFRAPTERFITSSRYLPISTLTGLFIVWFGIESRMKVQFLAFGIFVYLLPVVIQRVDEVNEVYVQTIKTLGAGKWQTIRHVFIPDVLSRISDDVRVLVAISWTYIIIAEVINTSDGGLGALAYIAARQSRIDKVFALLVVIVLIGYLQDKLFKFLDRLLFPHKYI